MEIALSEKEELLINQDYFQSNHKELKSKTKFFLFPTRPLTSILSRLFILTQVRVKNSKVQSLTLSSKKDPLEEVMELSIDQNNAFVIHPRSICGIN